MKQEVKSVHVTIHNIDNKITTIDENTVYGTVNALHDLTGRMKVLHVSIKYKDDKHKKANFDSKNKAISWLNLNDVNGKE